jgi:hypothetical protein
MSIDWRDKHDFLVAGSYRFVSVIQRTRRIAINSNSTTTAAATATRHGPARHLDEWGTFSVRNDTVPMTPASLFSAVQKFTRVVFLGDSTMRCLSKNIYPLLAAALGQDVGSRRVRSVCPIAPQAQWAAMRKRRLAGSSASGCDDSSSSSSNSSRTTRVLKQVDRHMESCWGRYFGVPQQAFSLDWRDQGACRHPMHYGAEHAGCTDCMRCTPQRYCWPRVSGFSSTGSGVDFAAEYYPLEFAHDCTLRALSYNTTQEMVADYLDSDDFFHGNGATGSGIDGGKALVFVNVGVHEVAHSTPDRYESDLRAMMLQLMGLPDFTLVWIDIARIDETKNVEHNYTNNANIQLFNQRARKIMGELWIDTLDVYTMGSDPAVTTWYHDRVHYTPRFYKQLGRVCLATLDYLARRD